MSSRKVSNRATLVRVEMVLVWKTRVQFRELIWKASKGAKRCSMNSNMYKPSKETKIKYN